MSEECDVIYASDKPVESQVRDLEDELGITAGAELELYFLRFGGISRGSVRFLELREIAECTKLFRSVAHLSGDYFVIEHRTSSVLALVDSTDKIWIYDQMKHVLVPADLDLFSYVLFRLGEFQEDLSLGDKIKSWWEDHRAIKSDIMRIVVNAWTLGCDREVITGKVMDYLEASAGYLPCSPKRFYDAYFFDFWPEF